MAFQEGTAKVSLLFARSGWVHYLLLILALIASLSYPTTPATQGAPGDLYGPTGSGAFGTHMEVLPNGNIVVTDPSYDQGAVQNVGAVYLYNGTTHTLISTLIGSSAEDQVGSGGIIVLTNGNYVISSPNWDNGSIQNAGAVTWGSGITGIRDTITRANSLVGSTADDRVGFVSDFHGITILTNGNYVVRSPDWDNGSIQNAGAVTWGNGTTGISGAVTRANSLVGSNAGDRVGYKGVITLTNGNYVVASPQWANGSFTQAGAVTWGNGSTGISGIVSSINSLVGSATGDRVGFFVNALTNGNYVVASPDWNNGSIKYAGAVTWGNGTTGSTGVVSPINSLVGSTMGDMVGSGSNDSGGITVLTNGNYVVASPYWSSGSNKKAGAVTWGNGTTGITGVVSSTNSLVGWAANDRVGFYGVTALTNGNYVVSSAEWANGSFTQAGAVTWGNGSSGTSGVVSNANSLVGSATDDQVGSDGVTALTNGNYVVASPFWASGSITQTGAVTWGNGVIGTQGVVSSANSLVGSATGDWVGVGNNGYDGVTALTNGNYVVASPHWSNGSIKGAGAVTWGNGSTGTIGIVNSANSLVGSSQDDAVGIGNPVYGGVTALTNGNYVVASPWWDNGSIQSAGAVTWGNGTTGATGVVSSTNSLVGSTKGDWVGSGVVIKLTNGNYAIVSPNWDNGSLQNAGAVIWGQGTRTITGTINTNLSVLGEAANTSPTEKAFVVREASSQRQLIVAIASENRIAFLALPSSTQTKAWLPLVQR